MATWGRSEKVTRTVRYHIPANGPWGAPWNQVAGALNAAVREYTVSHRAEGEPPDDAIRLHAHDDEIVIEFEIAAEVP